MTSPDELCLSCNHDLDDHVIVMHRDILKPAKNKCNGIYNVYDVHGDEQVGCACTGYMDETGFVVLGAIADMAKRGEGSI